MSGYARATATIILAACGGLGDGDTAGDLVCDASAAASVQLEVVDDAGAPVDGAEASYTVAGEEGADPLPCDTMPDGTIVCGWEVEGTLEIEVRAEGFLARRVEVTVASGPCHVETETVEVVLEPDPGAGGDDTGG